MGKLTATKPLAMGAALAMLAMTTPSEANRRFFDSRETDSVQQFWGSAGRYSVLPTADLQRNGAWQVRLTPEGSIWLWNYNRARGLGKVAPTVDAGAQNSVQATWETWIDARIAYDRAQAALEARKKNIEKHGLALPALSVVNDPGPIPSGLAALMPEPPPFAEAVEPRQHVVTFEDGTRHAMHDNPNMRPRFAFYRFREGVMDGGTSMRRFPEAELLQLLRAAGISDSERRIFTAVSLLEGGFDSINTYDTGYVSVGFIQFAALRAGGGSLAQVMLRQKRQDPDAFERDFQRYGLDVSEDGRLVALDLEDGTERMGLDAAMEIIQDKRLIAVFQRAGRISTPFRVAQLQVAKEMYYPADDEIFVSVDGRILAGRVNQIFRSEAGLAALMDRKVNTGRLDPLNQVIANIARRHNIREFAQLADFEREIIQGIIWRKNTLNDPTLSQPRTKPDTNSQGSPTFPPQSPR